MIPRRWLGKRQSDALLAGHRINFVTIACVVRELVHQVVKILGSYVYDNRTRLILPFSLSGWYCAAQDFFSCSVGSLQIGQKKYELFRKD